MKLSLQIDRLKEKVGKMAGDLLRSGHAGSILIRIKHSKVVGIYKVEDKNLEQDFIL